jgi:hypothetical protein
MTTWNEATGGWVGVPVPTRLVIGRSSRAAVVLTRVVAYPQGFEFDVLLRLREGRIRPLLTSPPYPTGDIRPPPNPFLAWRWQRMGDASAGAVRFELRAADTSWSVSNGQGPDDRADATAPLLLPLTNSFTEERGDSRWWVEPLPPPRPLSLSCEWLGQEVPPAQSTISGQLIRDAAEHSEQIWCADAPDDH